MHLIRVTGAFLLALPILLFSCSGEDGSKQSEFEKKGTEPQNFVHTETVEPEAPTKWYEGDAPTDVEKLQLLNEFQTGKRNFDFYAVFTEPFWTFYFFDNEVLIITMDAEVPEVVPIEYPFSENEEEQALSFMLNGEFWQFQVKKENGSDGMSEINYPYSVKLDVLEGGGATYLMRE